MIFTREASPPIVELGPLRASDLLNSESETEININDSVCFTGLNTAEILNGVRTEIVTLDSTVSK